jgi:hypothetical protein
VNGAMNGSFAALNNGNAASEVGGPTYPNNAIAPSLISLRVFSRQRSGS